MVPSVSHPEKTLTIKLEQTELSNAGNVMVLTIQNPFDRALKYHADIARLDQDKEMQTSTCPVMAKLLSSESWPEPIFSINLQGLHLVASDSPEAGTCSY